MMKPAVALMVGAVVVALTAVQVAEGQMKVLSDKDVDRIAAQWADEDDEDDDSPLKRMREQQQQQQQAPPMHFDPNNFDPSQLQQPAAASLKGQTKMIFARMRGSSKAENEKISGLFQGALQNNHIPTKVFPVDDTSILWVVDDGSLAPEIISYLTSQREVVSVELDQQTTWGKHTTEKEKREAEEKKNKSKAASSTGDKKKSKKNKKSKKKKKKNKKTKSKAKDEL
eukprot:m.251535 g.251535  ORF g.251535 m.251535 type:complete len:227 (+) comp19111_c3_seq2:1004-1684(+)